MTDLKRHRAVRWLVPVAVAALLVGGSVTINALTASADTSGLAPRTAAQLLVDVEQAKLGALSGTVVQTSDLGIPSLPGLGGGSSADLTSLISGTHTLRVWYDGTDKARIALLGTLGESDVIKNGNDLWTWSSQDNTATHRTLASDSPRAATPKSKALSGNPLGIDPTDLPKTPQEAAAAVLAAVNPSTIVTTDGAQSVAGRPVYQLTLRPRDSASLIGSVSVAIDGATHLPLRVQVFAAGQSSPAFEVAFTSVDFAAPDPAQFVFDPPPGATVTQVKPGAGVGAVTGGSGRAKPLGNLSSHAQALTSGGSPKVVGSGWTSVLVAPAGSAGAVQGQLGGVLHSLPAVSGPWGSGHLLAGALFSVVITSDGRVAVGAVHPDLLYAALTAK